MKIREARERYATWLRRRESRPKTIAGSLNCVQSFEAFLKRQGVNDIEAVTRKMLEEYKTALREKRIVENNRPLLHRTIEAYVLSIRIFFERAAANGWVSSNPAVGLLQDIRTHRPVQRFLTAEEMARVLARPDIATPAGVRDRLILELMYSTGIRMEEVLGMDLSDIDLKENLLRVRETVRGRERTVPLTPAIRALLTQYLKEIRPMWDRPMKYGGQRRRGTALFYSRRCGVMSEMKLEEIVGGHVRAVRPSVIRAGKVIRYACAARLLREGKTVAEVNTLFGQRKMRDTEVYLRAMRGQDFSLHPPV
jgi:integrase/recombinase XerD